MKEPRGNRCRLQQALLSGNLTVPSISFIIGWSLCGAGSKSITDGREKRPKEEAFTHFHSLAPLAQR